MAPTTKLYNFRFPPELVARIDRIRGQQNRTEWLKEAIDEKLAPHERMGRFECPLEECGFQADSPAAVCPTHLRQVRSFRT